ncbi:MFS transporter [Arthrobacter agilis]|uniref:MFS transporter n=1 Tax=Arthrobacter agilis TaxID=37921 RepID=UPI000B35FF7E|nr:MFS transporter [Arthrobacter agilis]OUM40664.1 MFS transporter [Arthrobacter agilis]PPB45274.1 MFS transporter [Arthrobacter agilis]TPV27980.1 MFS transporter [Arthrobacter agilis]VDR31331.1 Major Facilitator Superfamily [Arthrobacter agilis]
MRQQDQHADRRQADPGPAGPGADLVQRHVVRVLVVAQILGGLGAGATLSLGALLAAETSGSSAWSGMAATMATLGAAAAAVPLAGLAQRRGRRVSLATGSVVACCGALLAITAASLSLFPLLLVALVLLGSGSATGLQARFAATDLATEGTRGRSLSLVVWSTTIGAVLGPNLFEPGQVVAGYLGIPALSGGFVFTAVAQVAAALVYSLGLRPDPLLTALQRQAAALPDDARPPGGRRGLTILAGNPSARFAVATLMVSHAAMVSLMSMTPVHLHDHGAGLSVVGLTISLHVAGMYALSPVFGWIADRAGKLRGILLGQIFLLAALLIAWQGSESEAFVTLSLILLGLGWSASVVSASTLLAGAVDVGERAPVQGTSDLLMNLAGAVGGALAGPALVLMGYSGLGLAAAVLVAVLLAWTLTRPTSTRTTEAAAA